MRLLRRIAFFLRRCLATCRWWCQWWLYGQVHCQLNCAPRRILLGCDTNGDVHLRLIGGNSYPRPTVALLDKARVTVITPRQPLGISFTTGAATRIKDGQYTITLTPSTPLDWAACRRDLTQDKPAIQSVAIKLWRPRATLHFSPLARGCIFSLQKVP